LCRFTTDFISPPAPSVSSSDYPTDTITGGTGIPGAFTFSGNGVKDIVGFRYQWSDSVTYVAANRPGGTAAIQLTPDRFGAATLSVSSVDAAGNEANRTDYSFAVNDNVPTVSCTPTSAHVGVPRTCTVTRRDETNIALRYQLNNGPSTELAPGADGSATFTVTPDDPYVPAHVQVRARLANGNLTGVRTYDLWSDE